MNSEIPPRITIAPTPIATALLPLSPPFAPEVLGVVLGAAGEVLVWTWGEGGGRPGLSGFPGAARAAAGPLSASASTRASAEPPTRRLAPTNAPPGPNTAPPGGDRYRSTCGRPLTLRPPRPLTLRREWLLHRRRLGSVAVGLLWLDVLLVVDALGVDRPDVVVRPEQDVVDRPHRGEHRVV